MEVRIEQHNFPEAKKMINDFIADYFDKKYFEVYKSAFSPDKWAAAREILFLRYDSSHDRFYNFSDSAARLLAEEKETERLLRYVEQHLLLDSFTEYHTFFADAYPEETVALFRTALEQYAKKNVGRTHYEYILQVLRKMSRVKGGKKAASAVVTDLKARYKNRRAMVEVLNQFR